MIIYAIIGNAITIFLGRELSNMNADKFKSEADYRYALTHVRNNTESIAFFRGEAQESSILNRRFAKLIQSSNFK